jgi:putative serine protease PepD
MSDRRSLWVERQRVEDAEHGPFSHARWRAQAARVRPPVEEEAPAPVAEPRRRRFALLPTLALLTALAALAVGVVSLVDKGGSSDEALAPALVSGGKALPQGTIGRVYETAGPGVVSVQAGNATGTGFVVARDGTIVTNNHVVGENGTARVRFNDSGRQVEARVLGTDPSSDLAVLQVDPDESGPLRPLTLANSEKVQVGDTVIAIGHPFGLDRTATSGIVSGTGREIQAPNGFQIDDVIQTDAAINPGNSGGPLLDAKGRVIGVNSQIATSSGGSQGVGFAVSSNIVRDVLPRLRRGEEAQHPYLGVQFAPAAGGAEIAGLTSGGPAAGSDLRKGDVVLDIDGQRIRNADDAVSAISKRDPGDDIAIIVQRDGERRTFTVELGNRPRTP